MTVPQRGRPGATPSPDASERASWRGGSFQVLEESECRELLSSRAVGRLAFWTPDGPSILPVNHVADHDGIRFRTSPYNSITRHVGGTVVAFEVDEVDDFTESGWSVLVRGVAELLVGSSSDSLQPDPWPNGVRSVVVQIRPMEVSGRRVIAH